MGGTVRIGCGAGFWGDSPAGPAQLVRSGAIDYLILDYLAEVTMSILARLNARNPEAGYASDFVSIVMRSLAAEIAGKKIRVVCNAGGVNLEACRDALQAVLAEAGVDLKVAIVRGDDLRGRAGDLADRDIREMFSGAALPDRLNSVNAYLGAFPIAAALEEGADIVLTGRVVDSALALGPLIHEFGWSPTDHDRLAAGSLAGHVLECGAQATGGLFTDWAAVASGWDDMGFPIAECSADGTFELSKPDGTGGLVSPMTIAEQIVYEVGDPAAYILPDVICDFSGVRLEQSGPDRVRVRGAKGRAPTGSYKVCATWSDGYRSVATIMLAGRDAVAKARAVGEAILKRGGRLIGEAGFAPFTETLIEVIGGETTYGAASRAQGAREVMLKIGVRHPDKQALRIFGREVYPAGTAMAQGLTGFAGGRPEPQPVVRLFSFLLEKTDVPVEIECAGKTRAIAPFMANDAGEHPPAVSTAEGEPDAIEAGVAIPLLALAHGRSGDKGDTANIGLLARDPAFLPVIAAQVTPEAVRARFAHLAAGDVERYDWPGLNGFNFVLRESLGGGGIASLRQDAQGKAYAQMLLDMPVRVPAVWLEPGGPLEPWKEEAA